MADGVRVDLRRRRSLKTLLARLGEERNEAPGQPLSSDSLITEMWPGEKIQRKAARNRLHVAIFTLRTMGLGAALRFDGTGYHLDPAVPFEFIDDAPGAA